MYICCLSALPVLGVDDFASINDESKIVPESKPRVSVTLLGESLDAIDYLSSSQDINYNSAIRKALLTEAYLRKEIELGGKVLIQKPNGELREVVFR
jgi:hypothetical protein